jgi:hypothetical protein
MTKPATSKSAEAAKPAASHGTKIAHAGKLKVTGKPVIIGVGAFAIMNFMTVVSLRGLPAQAEYGLVSIFYYILAAVVFLVPTALVAAELASTFPKQGGVFRWVGEAFGPRWGFAAIYWQWQAWVLWFPAVLVFGTAALAYVWWPQSFDAALAARTARRLLGHHAFHVSRRRSFGQAEHIQRRRGHYHPRCHPHYPSGGLYMEGEAYTDASEYRFFP